MKAPQYRTAVFAQVDVHTDTHTAGTTTANAFRGLTLDTDTHGNRVAAHTAGGRSNALSLFEDTDAPSKFADRRLEDVTVVFVGSGPASVTTDATTASIMKRFTCDHISMGSLQQAEAASGTTQGAKIRSILKVTLE